MKFSNKNLFVIAYADLANGGELIQLNDSVYTDRDEAQKELSELDAGGLKPAVYPLNEYVDMAWRT